MKKVKSGLFDVPPWVRNLRELMAKHGLNPRSLSLKAGLNSTAVRDMLEGRSRFPRYDTVQALAAALETSPAYLMSDEKISGDGKNLSMDFQSDLELLAEIIARLQETTEDLGRKLDPRDFAAMAATIYHRMQATEPNKKKDKFIGSQIHDLLDYEMMRKKHT